MVAELRVNVHIHTQSLTQIHTDLQNSDRCQSCTTANVRRA